MHTQFVDAGHSENIRAFEGHAEFFLEPFRTFAARLRTHVHVYVSMANEMEF